MTTYQITLTTLSPLHIGDGIELRLGFDFILRSIQGQEGPVPVISRLDENALLAAKSDQVKPDQRGAYPVPASLLTAEDIQNGQFFRYTLRGQPRTQMTDGRMRTCIKDPFDVPYIPGSSLKGALRTALAWSAWQGIMSNFGQNDLGYNSKSAAATFEKKLFGRDPNHDLMRALQVSDLHLVQHEKGATMAVYNINVMTRRGLAAPIEVESVLPGKVFTGTLKIDEFLFSRSAEAELGFGSRRAWLTELLPRVQKHSAARLEALARWFETAERGETIAKWYRDTIANTQTFTASAAVLQLGWGAGWDAKTYGSHLQKDPVLFEQIVSKYSINRASRNASARRPGDPFPKSRRVMIHKDRPARPMGWVLIELTELSHA